MGPTVESLDISFALRKAHYKIQSGAEEFICIALNSAFSNEEITRNQYHLSIAYIRRLLDGYSVYEDWMETYHPDKFKEMIAIAAKDTLFLGLSPNERVAHKKYPFRIGRLQWLNHLIVYLEKRS